MFRLTYIKNYIKSKKNALIILPFKQIFIPLHSQFGNELLSMVKHRGVEQLVARQAHNLEVARSSLASATKMLGSLLFMKIPSISRNMTGTETGHNFIV